MKILALAMLSIVTFSQCFSYSFCNEFENIGLSVEEVYYEGHDYIVINCRRTCSNTVLHSPNCVKCKNWYDVDVSRYQTNADIKSYQSCVEVKSNGNYFVDSSGSVDIV